MTETCEILEFDEGELHTLRVLGELDIATAPDLDRRLRTLLEQHRQIRLDLSELSFLDSTGIAVLVTAARAAARDGGEFALSGVSASALRVLELSGVLRQLNLLPGQT